MKIESFRGQYRFLSNFWPCDIYYNGYIYNGTEYAYQAAKTTSKEDHEKIVLCRTPGNTKRVIRTLKIRGDWDEVKDQVMLDLLRIKFSKPGLGKALLLTGDAEIIEGNTWNDTYWGVCKGVGENKLGKLLMQVREELRAKQNSKVV